MNKESVQNRKMHEALRILDDFEARGIRRLKSEKAQLSSLAKEIFPEDVPQDEISIDVRLQYEDGTPTLRFGDPSFDQSHLGHWGAGSIQHDTDVDQLWDDLVGEVLESMAMDPIVKSEARFADYVKLATTAGDVHFQGEGVNYVITKEDGRPVRIYIRGDLGQFSAKIESVVGLTVIAGGPGSVYLENGNGIWGWVDQNHRDIPLTGEAGNSIRLEREPSMNYEKILNELIATDDAPEPVKVREQYFKDADAVICKAKRDILKPFFGRTREGTVGLAIVVDDKPDMMFCAFPSRGNSPVIGLVDKDDIDLWDQEFIDADQVIDLNSPDAEEGS